MKNIVYRGGLVLFSIPAHWKEEYDPEGGGTFYKDSPDSGTLRLNVISFKLNPETGDVSPFQKLGYTPFRNNLFLKSESKDFTEEEIECTIFNWDVGYATYDNSHCRIASFNYTIRKDQMQDDDIQKEMKLVEETIQRAEFSREQGVSEDYQQ